MKENLFSIGLFVTLILATMMTAYLVNRFFKRLIRRSTEDMKNDPTNYQFLRHVSTAMIYITGFSIAIYSVPDLRTLASTLLAGVSIIAINFFATFSLLGIIG